MTDRTTPHGDARGDTRGHTPVTIDQLWAITHTAGQRAHQRAVSAGNAQLAAALNFAAYTLDIAADDLQAAGARTAAVDSADSMHSNQGSGGFTPATVMQLRDACVQVIDYTHNPDHAEAALAVLELTDDLSALLGTSSPAAQS